MFGKLGTSEIFVIFAMVVLIFGPTQLPKLSRMFGETIKGVKEGLQDSNDERTE